MPITHGLHRSLQATPQETATRFGHRVRTFEEQAERVGRLAAGLQELGIARGDRLAILALNSDRYLELLLAISWGGAVFNPLNIRWSPNEIEYGLSESKSRVLAVDDEFVPLAQKLRDRCPTIERLIYLGDAECPSGMLAFEEIIAAHSYVEDLNVSDSDVAGLFYTGGTTGVPRGVMLTHANLTASALGPLASGDILSPGAILHVAPLFHLAGIWPWLIQLMRGGTHVVQAGFDPKQICDAVNEADIPNLFLVPTMIQRLLEHLVSSQTTLPSLRRMLYAGSPIPEAVLDQLQSMLPGVGLCQVYGMTELSPVATVLTPEDHLDRLGNRRRSAGRAAAHALVRVIDPAGKNCGSGEVGEVVVSGANVMLGYLNKPAETASAVRDGWLRTGDAGYLDADGFLYVVDRIKDMIVTGGENVYSVEVENAIMGHPAVANCAVIGLPDERWGERVHAVVVLHAGAVLDLDGLRAHVSTRIARYKVPRSLGVVEALPVSAAGKVLKRELRANLVAAPRLG